MFAQFPTAEIGAPEWDAQVAESVRQQLDAQDLAWRQQFAPETLPKPSTQQQGGADVLLLAGIGAAVWFLARSKPKRRKRANRR